MASASRSNVPASTISSQRRSYSSADPSHQWIESGWVSSATSSTQAINLGFSVRVSAAAVVSDKFRLNSFRALLLRLVTRPGWPETGANCGAPVT